MTASFINSRVALASNPILWICYYEDMGRGLPTRSKDHRADLRYHGASNALVLHAERSDHLPYTTDDTAMHRNLTKTKRRVQTLYAAEACYEASHPGL